MGGDGEKISDTDLSTFATLYRAYEFSQCSVIFVINQVKKKLKTEEDKREYRNGCYEIISEYILQNLDWSIDTPFEIE